MMWWSTLRRVAPLHPHPHGVSPQTSGFSRRTPGDRRHSTCRTKLTRSQTSRRAKPRWHPSCECVRILGNLGSGRKWQQGIYLPQGPLTGAMFFIKHGVRSLVCMLCVFCRRKYTRCSIWYRNKWYEYFPKLWKGIPTVCLPTPS